MLGATQAVLLGAAGCPFVGYAATVTGIPGLLAYWRLSDAGGLIDQTAGARHGTYDGPVSLVAGLPTNSDAATHLPGTVVGTIPHDAGLELAAFTLSFWFMLNELPTSATAILSKDASGLNAGDFSIIINNENGDCRCQLQSGAAQFSINFQLEAGVIYHMVVTVDSGGFELWINGKHIGTDTGFTGAWASNTQAIKLATAIWSGGIILDVVIDEIPLYSRVLTDAEITTLSQNTQAPAVNADSAVVAESQTVVIDVAGNDSYVGRKSDLTVELWNGSAWASSASTTHGTASVNANNDIEFEAGTVTEDEADSFDYRITDANGTSAGETVSLTIQDTVSVGGGTLVYEWEPLPSWIDGVSLANRNANDVHILQPWIDGANVGSSLPKEVFQVGGQARYCWNRAPTGHPSMEIHSAESNMPTQPNDAPMLFLLRLYDRFQGTPRHLRVVMEIKTCKTGDPTTFKGQGLGTTGGGYPNWRDSYSPGGPENSHTSGKYFLGQAAGQQAGGGGNINWWKDSDLPIDRGGYRVAWQFTTKELNNYMYVWDRNSQFGGGTSSTATADDVGVHGVWHRLEFEVSLTTPGTVPANAVRNESQPDDPMDEPSHTGDGFSRIYLAKDIDGELGTPGAREQISQKDGMIFFCKADNLGSFDNLHLASSPGANLLGVWFCLIYGGGIYAQAEAWAWIRKIQVYRHD